MSLDDDDIEKIRVLFREEIQAVESDVKELYYMVSDLQIDTKELKGDVRGLRTDVNFIAGHLRLDLPTASK